ncbi:MAG TPA: hypothetical protein VNR63_02180 [Gaiellaceae bacterium]|jgi:hypothetical protein|nr:hypothetical protein [Gaiellaceae bacterium]
MTLAATVASALAIFQQLLAGFGDRSLIRAHVSGDRDLTYLRFAAPPHATRIRLQWEQTIVAGAFRDRLHAAHAPDLWTWRGVDGIHDARRAENPYLQRFRSPPERVFRARLAVAAKRWHFRVLDARYLRPLQGAPMVVVQTTDPIRLSRAAGGVREYLRSLEYEGFYFEAEDSHNVPAFAFASALRGTNMGSQWARSERLFPFAYG